MNDEQRLNRMLDETVAERDQLRDALAAMTERAQAAEAKLSDIPWDSLGVALRYSQEADAVLWYQDNQPQQEAQP